LLGSAVMRGGSGWGRDLGKAWHAACDRRGCGSRRRGRRWLFCIHDAGAGAGTGPASSWPCRWQPWRMARAWFSAMAPRYAAARSGTCRHPRHDRPMRPDGLRLESGSCRYRSPDDDLRGQVTDAGNGRQLADRLTETWRSRFTSASISAMAVSRASPWRQCQTSRPARRGSKTSLAPSVGNAADAGHPRFTSQQRAPRPCGPLHHRGLPRVQRTRGLTRTIELPASPTRTRDRATGFIHRGSACRGQTYTESCWKPSGHDGG
jgi:hypothetical protein